jgi:hypothetical protein
MSIPKIFGGVQIMKLLNIHLTFDVLTAVKMSIVVFRVLTPCDLVGGYQCFGGTYRLHLQGDDGGDTLLSFRFKYSTQRHVLKYPNLSLMMTD